MKAIITFTILISLNLSAKAQYISLDELIKFTNNDFDYVNNYLGNKGWRFTEAKEESEDYKACVSWGYGVNNFTTAGTAFINMYPEDDEPAILSYQTLSKVYYDMYKKKITDYRMQKINSFIENGSIVTLYSGENYLVRIELSTDTMSNKPIYIFRINHK